MSTTSLASLERLTKMQDTALAQQDPNTLAFYIKTRNGRKREYIFDYSKAKTCDHPNLTVIARGGIVYRCQDCNFTYHITGAYAQPLHNELIMAAFTILSFSKEFGQESVAEVLRTPIGQSDGSQHKPVLPEGKSFADVLALVEGIDVTTEDGGKQALQQLLGEVWEAQAPRLSEGVKDDGNKAITGDRDQE
jgi:hypothetical protein